MRKINVRAQGIVSDFERLLKEYKVDYSKDSRGVIVLRDISNIVGVELFFDGTIHTHIMIGDNSSNLTRIFSYSKYTDYSYLSVEKLVFHGVEVAGITFGGIGEFIRIKVSLKEDD